MRAAVYIRMSLDVQEDSPERQRATTNALIEREGFTYYDAYVDPARRGWDNERPRFKQLLEDAQKGLFDCIVVDECSRLSRNDPIEFFGQVVYPLRQAGVKLYSVAEGGLQDWDNLPGVLLSAVYQDRSSGESKKTAWRVATGLSRLSADARIDLGNPPYGYARLRLDNGRYSYKIDPERAEVVRLIFSLYADHDMSLRDICRELGNRFIPTPTGKVVWTQNCVGRILRELKYAGFYVFNRVRQGKFFRIGAGSVEKAPSGSPTGTNPREAWRVIPNNHEPIIPPDLFARVQELLSKNRTRTTPTPLRGGFLLTKLVYCAACGSPMHGHRNENGVPFYRCGRAMGTAQAHCFNNLVKESDVLDWAMRTLREKFLAPSFFQMCREEARRLQAESSSDRHLAALRAELETLEGDIGRTLIRLPKVDDETFGFLNRQLGEWRARKRVIEGELANAPDRVAITDQMLSLLEEEIRQLDAALLGKKPSQQVSAYLRKLIDRLELKVERRLVGKVKHRYYLVGGRLVLTKGGFAMSAC